MADGTQAQPVHPIPGAVCDRDRQRKALVAALRTVSYEVLPLRGTDELVGAHLRPGSSITITTTQARPSATVDLAEKLAATGYCVTPHIAARAVRDDAHFTDIVVRLREAGIDRIFVVAGDIHQPAGSFTDSLGLLTRLRQHNHRFVTVGIAGYPEGHGSISDLLIEKALLSKAPYANEIITQICFHPETTARWARAVKHKGVTLPIRVGIPGAVARRKLARISARLGLGASARFISKQHGMLARLLLPRGYQPKRLVERLVPWLGSPATNIAGLHVFTFNELQHTEA